MDGTPPKSERLGLSTAQVGPWRGLAKLWKRLYLQSKSKIQSTPLIREERDLLWKQFVRFAQPIVNMIAASPELTTGDRSAFNMDPPPARGRRRGRIKGRPFTKMRNGEGASIRVKCRASHQGRPRMHPLADLIEMRYALQSPTEIKDGVLQWPARPKSPDECPVVVLSSRAIFTLKVGMKNTGKQLCAYFR